MKTEHKYAQVLRWIADGEKVQMKHYREGWITPGDNEMLSSISIEEYAQLEFRIKPKTIMIGDVECEAPVLEPKDGQKLWWLCSIKWMPACGLYNGKDNGYQTLSNAGLLFTSKEACLAAHNAITKLLTQSK